MTAIAATFADFKLIKGRKVCQLHFEIPMEKAKEALDLLGMPNPHAEQWVGIALLAGEPTKQGASEKPKRHWHEMTRAQQAGILCSEKRFRGFLADEHLCNGANDMFPNEEEAANFIRQYCGVKSRADLDMSPVASAGFDGLVVKYRQWAGLEPEQRG